MSAGAQGSDRGGRHLPPTRPAYLSAVWTDVNVVFKLLAEAIGFEGRPAFGPHKEGDVARNALDASAAQDSLGWKPWTHFEDGVRETVAYFREKATVP